MSTDVKPLESFFIPLSVAPSSLGVELDQYWGTWAIYRPHFEKTLGILESMDLQAHVKSNQEFRSEDDLFEVTRGGVAIIEISGTMTKRGSSLSRGGSTVRARRAVRTAASREDVESILLHIESPGGTSAGTKELADDVRAAANSKRTVAFIEDIGASAAYWVASQCNEIYANDMAMVGSIGTYMAVADYSKWADESGIKVYVISTGDFKGAGVPGSKIEQMHLDEWQRLVNQGNGFFLDAVRTARRMTAAELTATSDGRVHLAADATKLKLIDGVRTLDQVLTDMSADSQRRTHRMSDTTTTKKSTEPEAASLEQLEAAFPKADANWYMAQLKAKSTLQQARTNWQSKLEADLDAATQRAEAAEKAAAEKEQKSKTSPKLVGNDPVGTRNPAKSEEEDVCYGDQLAEFQTAVDARAKEILSGNPTMRPMTARRKAMNHVRRRNPQLASFLDSNAPEVSRQSAYARG